MGVCHENLASSESDSISRETCDSIDIPVVVDVAVFCIVIPVCRFTSYVFLTDGELLYIACFQTVFSVSHTVVDADSLFNQTVAYSQFS